MKPITCKHCGAVDRHHSFQCYSQLKPIKRKPIVKPKLVKSKSDRSVALGKWFNDQIATMPRACENCSVYLSPNIHITQRAYIAHIVPKRHFESVMTHKDNRLFLCVDCHAKYDNGLSRETILMKCWPVAVERFKRFVNEINRDEIRHLRPCFVDLI